MPELAPRIHAILARSSSTAVVLRRGPSKQVLMLRWDRSDDRFERGQWLKARVYERRCDLSPDGSFLVYFAASWKPPHESWTAVSRPPYFTALALWAKGDAWGGGGLFEHDRRLALNHRTVEAAPTSGRVDGRWSITQLGEHPGRGEDSPIYDIRMERDGWTPQTATEYRENRLGAETWIEYDPPVRRTKQSPVGPEQLEVAVRGLHQRNGPWYVQSHRVLRGDVCLLDLGDSDWAEWDNNGDLLFARDGRLWRLPHGAWDVEEAGLLIDLRHDAFEPVAPPDWARHWGGRRPR